MKLLRLPAALLLVSFAVAVAQDRERPREKAPAAKTSAEQARAFLARHCVGCHGEDNPRGALRLDQLSTDFAAAAVRERWLAVRERLDAGEMPPKAKPRPPQDETKALSAWI